VSAYDEFVARKLQRVPPTGMTDVPELHPSLFPHQRDLVRWALRRGRAAIFAATGLGKSCIEVEWASRVVEHTGGSVLILAPLAVAQQTIREAERIGVVIRYVKDRDAIADDETGVFISNYDRLHLFDAGRFVGVVLDESSIIKNHTAKTLKALIEFARELPWRLCATATPAPNDYTELGTHAEFLGVCSQAEMLAEYFCHDGGETQTWRLKGHARGAYWAWVATWGALLRKPSDLGYDDGAYALPPLHVHQHVIAADQETVRASRQLFAIEARTLTERRSAKKASQSARVAACVATIALEPDEQWLVWCDLNAESEALAKAIPGAVEIRGSNTPEEKERALLGFADGDVRVLVTKPSIAGWGMNFQRAARMSFVGVTDSWESYYQAIRREWRFGQRRDVHVHIFSSEVEGRVVENLRRKEADAGRMAEELALETREAMRAEVKGSTRETNHYQAPRIFVPAWLTGEAATR
jgi:superfamily II DNA or RNA helicase